MTVESKIKLNNQILKFKILTTKMNQMNLKCSFCILWVGIMSRQSSIIN